MRLVARTTFPFACPPPQATFEIGHPVPLRIELQNCGQRDLWIALSYEQNLGFPANLPLIVRDIHRRQVLPHGYLLLGGLGEPPYEWWIRLPPGYLYGRDFTLTQYYSEAVNMPGRYQISVTYTGIPRSSSSKRPPSTGRLGHLHEQDRVQLARNRNSAE